MTAEITTEKARIGAPSIAGFTEEGESLSPLNAAESKSPLAGDAVPPDIPPALTPAQERAWRPIAEALVRTEERGLRK